MKRKNFFVAFVIFAAMIVFLGVGSAYAQGVRAASGKSSSSKAAFRLKKLTEPKNSLVKSPEFDGKVNRPDRNNGKNKRWAAVEAEYVTTVDWVDEMTFTFHVLTEDSKKEFHYFTTTVTYLDIAKGEHGACVMLPPAAVVRYGTPTALGVEVEAEGKQLGVEMTGIKSPWWTQLDKIKKLERHSGYLQDRSKTPFGMTHIDEYEVVR